MTNQALKNESLYISVENFSNSFRFLTYNVDQAVREEAFEETKWENRKKRVAALIKEVDADIVCLQEFRQLSGNETPEQFLASHFGDTYRFSIEYRNPGPMAFGQAILWKPEKFYPIRSEKRWLSDFPKVVSDTWSEKSGGTTGFGYMVTGILFVCIADKRVIRDVPPFWIFNTHFGLEEELKTKSCVKLGRLIQEFALSSTKPPSEYILLGDFNLFPDRDAKKQREILGSFFNDLAQGAETLDGKKIEGTFVGYEHDDFKADLKNMVSRLDNIFASPGVTCHKPVLYTKTMLEEEPAELTTRSYPSDHLPLVAEISVQQKKN